MKKIGIITMYHDSINYGGVLQAFALQKAISRQGHVCKQIDFLREHRSAFSNIKIHFEERSIYNFVVYAVKKIKNKLSCKHAKLLIDRNIKFLMDQRKEKFKLFRDNIPHTETYNKNTIVQSNGEFDIFICGSDQIWKPGVICSEYLLNFVKDSKKKVAYAASISKKNIKLSDLQKIGINISDFNLVSVREKMDIVRIQKVSTIPVEWVVDPTMLLTKDDWINECSDMICDSPYIFCYLLGIHNKQITAIRQAAEAMGLSIVTIPFATGEYNLIDFNFGDIKIYDAGPRDFLNIIRYAEYVITDSFHATVFANIFQRKFFVLDRAEEMTMNERILSLLDIYKQKDRFVNEKQLYDMMLKDQGYIVKKNEVDTMITRSQNFLERILEK